MRADLVRAKQAIAADGRRGRRRGPAPGGTGAGGRHAVRLMQAATASAEDTQALAARLAPLTAAGDLLVLLGDLGAGKTAFVKGLARGARIARPVTSPTFTIAQRYTGGRLTVHHLDAYRLAGPEEAATSPSTSSSTTTP